MAKKDLPEINASSLADIAFLLLTFFLIATSMDKREGIQKKIPDPLRIEDQEPTPKRPRDVLEISLNTSSKEVLIKDERMNPLAIRQEVKKHVLNNGDGTCTYCVGGQKLANYSTNPAEAVVLIRTLKSTPFEAYITAQNEVDKAYNEIWDDYCKRNFNMTLKDLEELAKGESDEDQTPEVIDARNKLKDLKTYKFKKQIGEAKPKS